LRGKGKRNLPLPEGGRKKGVFLFRANKGKKRKKRSPEGGRGEGRRPSPLKRRGKKLHLHQKETKGRKDTSSAGSINEGSPFPQKEKSKKETQKTGKRERPGP